MTRRDAAIVVTAMLVRPEVKVATVRAALDVIWGADQWAAIVVVPGQRGAIGVRVAGGPLQLFGSPASFALLPPSVIT